MMNCGLGAIHVKRIVVELTGSACTLPGAMVGTEKAEEEEERGREEGKQRGKEKRHKTKV